MTIVEVERRALSAGERQQEGMDKLRMIDRVRSGSQTDRKAQ